MRMLMAGLSTGFSNFELMTLRLLDQEVEMHGYEMVQRLKALNVKALMASEGTIYPILARFEAKGLVKARWEKRRKYYRITTKGRSTLVKQTTEWLTVSNALKDILLTN